MSASAANTFIDGHGMTTRSKSAKTAWGEDDGAAMMEIDAPDAVNHTSGKKSSSGAGGVFPYGPTKPKASTSDPVAAPASATSSTTTITTAAAGTTSAASAASTASTASAASTAGTTITTSATGAPSPAFNVTDMDKVWGVASKDVHELMRERENIHRTYNPEAKWLQYRRVLVDWMCEAGDEFGLHISTMHVAVMYLDRLLHAVSVNRNELQLVAIACILIAAKYEEVEEVVPTLSEMNRHAQWAFSAEAIQRMEFEVLRKLNWCLGTFTPLHFASYFMSKGVLFEADTMQGRSLAQKVPKYMKRYIEFFADLCLQDYAFQRFSPSMMAAAIVMASRKALGIRPLWRDELSTNTQYKKNDINPCFKAVWSCYRFNFPNAPCASNGTENQDHSPTSVDEL